MSPMYEFACKVCQKLFEKLYKIKEIEAVESKAPCPKCGKPAEKVMSAPNWVVPGGADHKVKGLAERREELLFNEEE